MNCGLSLLEVFLGGAAFCFMLQNVGGDEGLEFDLPLSHVAPFLNRRPDLRNMCMQNDNCKYKKEAAKLNRCWGYEDNCGLHNSQYLPHCPHKSSWPNAQNTSSQVQLFFNQADFGIVRQRREQMKSICQSNSKANSFLSCSDHLRYCYAQNIFVDFKSLKCDYHHKQYREDVIQPGEIGGHCDIFAFDLLSSRSNHKGFLQSWAQELTHFKSYDRFSVSYEHCDIIVDQPSVLIKLDAGISMYHHFCDFLNLYMSQHINGSFDRNIQIFIWETHSVPYRDLFAETWKVFTDLPLREIREFDGRKVCFRSVMFPLLARMQFGLYYNMPLVDGCYGSSLVRHFSEHVLHRLKIAQDLNESGLIRVTLLSRSTKYRRITNENELLEASNNISGIKAQIVDYNINMPFLDQIKLTHNTDVFIGMHGSGLTHLLFLPDWAAVFEIYNCEDVHCYADLARLRKVRYFTWENADKLQSAYPGRHPTMDTPHAKFTDYAFDVSEFLRILNKAVNYVRHHPEFISLQEKIKKHKQEQHNTGLEPGRDEL